MKWECDDENDGHHRMIYIIHHTSVDYQANLTVFVVNFFVLLLCLERCLFVVILSSFYCVARCPPVGPPANLTATVQTSVSAVSTDAPTLAEKVTMQLFFCSTDAFNFSVLQFWFTVVRHLAIPSRIHSAEAPTANNCYYSWLQLWRAKGIEYNTGRICFWWQKLHLSFDYA